MSRSIEPTSRPHTHLSQPTLQTQKSIPKLEDVLHGGHSVIIQVIKGMLRLFFNNCRESEASLLLIRSNLT